MGDLVGAKSPLLEVGIMNATTVNIHIVCMAPNKIKENQAGFQLFAAFFRPTPTRYKVLIEDMAFPSDFYAVESQLRQNGLNPKEAMICLRPREVGVGKQFRMWANLGNGQYSNSNCQIQLIN
jgi:kynureninase